MNESSEKNLKTPVAALDANALCWRCDEKGFDFATTDELEDLNEILGQARAMEAVQFGIGMRRHGYNLYVLGPPGAGKRTIVRQFLDQQSAHSPPPDDWCYVHNFDLPHKPKALRLPNGQGAQFRDAMQSLIEDLRTSIPAALDAEEHKNRVQEVEQEAKEHHDQAFRELAEKAASQGIQLVRTPGGFALAPIRDGEVLSPEEFDKLPEDEQNRIEQVVRSLQKELQELIEQVPDWRKEMRDKIKEMNREAARFAIGHLFSQVKQKYGDLPDLQDYLGAVEQDVIESADQFRAEEQEETPTLFGIPMQEPQSFQPYEVNLLVDNSQTKGAPVVFEEHPNYQNVLGRVEHRAQMGTLFTDFTLIKSGALHRANGGFFVVEALKLLQQPYAWEGLKRALHTREIKIESLAEALSLVSTVSLEPEPIPLDVKVVLLGERMLYYLLYQYDREFAELFKVAADFEDRMDRSPENCRLYARLIATLLRREKHRPFDRAAVARVLEHAARVADDSEKLTTHVRTISDLLREADYWAGNNGNDIVRAEHVEQAIEKQTDRVDRIRDLIQEEIQRGTFLIDTDGEQIGQVNGLSVIDLGNFSFGRPSRITATARLGKGEVIDIEREVELGGSTHSKGVLILSSFLAARYAKNHPLSLSASLVFEQSYGMIDGDSASVAELCALLSSLAEAPIKQSLAVTGSVNQHGHVQPIGGVNEKIEGFFDVCRFRGLTGRQGVLIPKSNVKHLMLRHDVREAATAGKFHIWPVETVNQAVSLLTGLPAGETDGSGKYPADSLNGRVAARLLDLFELRKSYSEEVKAKSRNE